MFSSSFVSKSLMIPIFPFLTAKYNAVSSNYHNYKYCLNN